MTDNNVQVSVKTSNGVIYVVGGRDVDEFSTNLMALAGGEQDLAESVLSDMLRCLTPAAAGAVAGPQAGGGQFYTPTAQPAQQISAGVSRTATVPVAVKIPWAEKAQADPFLTPLKASRQAQWDATNKQWILMPGTDLGPFARWLPPGT